MVYKLKLIFLIFIYCSEKNISTIYIIYILYIYMLNPKVSIKISL